MIHNVSRKNNNIAIICINQKTVLFIKIKLKKEIANSEILKINY